LLKNIDKSDPRIIELNNKLKEFRQFLNKANHELANLSFSVNDVSWTTINYQQCTCDHKFTVQQDYDTLNDNFYTYNVCSNCELVNDF